MEKHDIVIEVAYAKPERQLIIVIKVQPNCTIEEAIYQSGILQEFPEINLQQQAVGIFSQPKQLVDKVSEGDRIEIYRPLFQDPKERRRAKAKSKV